MAGLLIEGFASLYNLEDLSGDVVLPGAFDETLGSTRPVPMLYQHDPAEPVGRWHRLSAQGRGLWVEGEVFEDSRAGSPVASLVRRGAVNGLSIGFRTRQSCPRRAASRGRFLERVELWEVSIVTFPMLPQARLQLADPSRRAA